MQTYVRWHQISGYLKIGVEWGETGVRSYKVTQKNFREWSICSLSSFFLVYFYYFERERASPGGAEREGDRIPSRLCAVSAEPDGGLRLTSREIMTWAKVKSWMLNRLGHPYTPICLLSWLWWWCFMDVHISQNHQTIHLNTYCLLYVYYLKVKKAVKILLRTLIEKKNAMATGM